MPVRWTDDKKALLFVTIMNTHQLSVDAKLVVDAWPDNAGEKPTERAIREILNKIKKTVAKSGGASASATPIKGKVSKSKFKATPRSTKKRKVDDDPDSESPSPSSTRKDLKELGGAFSAPKRDDSVVAPACHVTDLESEMGVTDRVDYLTPAGTTTPVTLTRHSTPLRAASVKVTSYVKADQEGSGDDDDDHKDASDPESDGSIGEWEINGMIDEL